MTKNVQVIMLATNTGNHPSIIQNSFSRTLFVSDDTMDSATLIVRSFGCYHLYFTSNEEEIKEGDWFINEEMHYGLFQNKKEAYTPSVNWVGKVIATTDKSLGLPLIPSYFVRDYVKAKGVIQEVEVETMGRELILFDSYKAKYKMLDFFLDEYAPIPEWDDESWDNEDSYAKGHINQIRREAFLEGVKSEKKNNWQLK